MTGLSVLLMLTCGGGAGAGEPLEQGSEGPLRITWALLAAKRPQKPTAVREPLIGSWPLSPGLEQGLPQGRGTGAQRISAEAWLDTTYPISPTCDL